MTRLLLLLLGFFLHYATWGQTGASATVPRPKLIVGIVVDQMRWDYFYRYYDRYSEAGGFRRLLNRGFSCDQTYIPYVPTFTACGHSAIYTGSVPAITGITGNDWWDYEQNRFVYCTQDDTVSGVGSQNENGKMSPVQMKGTTVGDELQLATQYRSRVIGIALKDRGAILAAGRSATGAYWYDNKTGDWITSTYYRNDLPAWVQQLNAKKLVDQYYQQGWKLLLPAESYTASAKNDTAYKVKVFGGAGFPINLQQFAGRNYGILPVTPFGNTLTFEMAKAAIEGEQLGSRGTDLLAISFSAPDYIGHNFGPQSIEAEDGFLRLDKELGEFMDYLDSKIGKDDYLLFLTADHGMSQVPGYLQAKKVDAGSIDAEGIGRELNTVLREKFKLNDAVIGFFNNQIYLERNVLAASKADKTTVENFIIDLLEKKPGISRVVPLRSVMEVPLNSRIREAIVNGYYPSRSGDLQVIAQPDYVEGFLDHGSTHGAWNPQDAHIPLVWYGWNIKPGHSSKRTHITDIAVTLCSLIRIQAPSGAVGEVIEDVKR